MFDTPMSISFGSIVGLLAQIVRIKI